MFANARREGDWGPNLTKPSVMAWFLARRNEGRWWAAVGEVVVAGGLCVPKHAAGEGAGDKADEIERNGSISSAPCETTMEGNGGRWWDEVDDVVVVMGLCVRKCEARGGAGAKSNETERDGGVSGAP